MPRLKLLVAQRMVITIRCQSLPTPTSLEADWQDSYLATWYGVFAPKRTPQQVLRAGAKAIKATAQAPEVQSSIRMAGTEPLMNIPEEFVAEIARDNDHLSALTQRLPIQ